VSSNKPILSPAACQRERYQMAGKCFAFPIMDITLLAPYSLKSSFPNLVNDTMHTLDFIINTIELLIKKNPF